MTDAFTGAMNRVCHNFCVSYLKSCFLKGEFQKSPVQIVCLNADLDLVKSAFAEHSCVRVWTVVVWVGRWAAVWEGDDGCVWVGGSAGGESSLYNNGLSEILE